MLYLQYKDFSHKLYLLATFKSISKAWGLPNARYEKIGAKCIIVQNKLDAYYSSLLGYDSPLYSSVEMNRNLTSLK